MTLTGYKVRYRYPEETPDARYPSPFDPSVEAISEREAEAIDQLRTSFTSILDTTSRDYGHAVRSVHAKGHGIVQGMFAVKSGLPAELAQGLFAQAGDYEALLRFSTAPGDILDDAVSSRAASRSRCWA